MQTSLFVVFVVALTACTDETPSYPIQSGTYEITRRIEQDTGADRTPANATLTVTLTPDALTLASATVPFPSFEIPGADGAYHVAQYSAGTTNCEAGPNKMCVYGFTEVTVIGQGASSVRIETCSAREIDTLSCSSTPSCPSAKAEARIGSHPCAIDGVVEGDFVSP